MKLNDAPFKDNDFWQGTISDIAFLLIIFFILTTVFSVPYIIRFTSGEGQDTADRNNKTINAGINVTGEWFMDNKILTRKEFKEVLSRENRYSITVNDRRPYQEFIDLLDTFDDAGIKHIEILTDNEA